MTDHPALDKMRQAKDEGHSQEIGAFLEWLSEKGYVLARYEQPRWSSEPLLFPTRKSVNDVLAEYFGIDLAACEHERMALLEGLRARNKS